MKDKHFATNQGVPVSDNQNSLTVGERGRLRAKTLERPESAIHKQCYRGEHP
jgi:catalase